MAPRAGPCFTLDILDTGDLFIVARPRERGAQRASILSGNFLNTSHWSRLYRHRPRPGGYPAPRDSAAGMLEIRQEQHYAWLRPYPTQHQIVWVLLTHAQ